MINMSETRLVHLSPMKLSANRSWAKRQGKFVRLVFAFFSRPSSPSLRVTLLDETRLWCLYYHLGILRDFRRCHQIFSGDMWNFTARLEQSFIVGAIGGSIVIIPCSICHGLIGSLIVPIPVNTRDERAGKWPFQRHSSLGKVAKSLRDAINVESFETISQRAQRLKADEAPQTWRILLAAVADLLTFPAFGALSGAVGSLVLERTDNYVVDVSRSARAGAIGGFMFSPPVGALVFVACVSAISAFLSWRRSS